MVWDTIEQFASGQTPKSLVDYTALSNFALLSKFQTLISTDPQHGPSQILNLMWTDLMANNVLGTDSRSILVIQANLNVPSTAYAYDVRFAVPALLLLILWVPMFGVTIIVLTSGMLKFSHIRHLLNHTGAGRIALGNSALKPLHPDGSSHMVTSADRELLVHLEDEKDWAKGAGRTPVYIQPSGRDAPSSGTSMEFVPLSTQEK